MEFGSLFFFHTGVSLKEDIVLCLRGQLSNWLGVRGDHLDTFPHKPMSIEQCTLSCPGYLSRCTTCIQRTAGHMFMLVAIVQCFMFPLFSVQVWSEEWFPGSCSCAMGETGSACDCLHAQHASASRSQGTCHGSEQLGPSRRSLPSRRGLCLQLQCDQGRTCVIWLRAGDFLWARSQHLGSKIHCV